MDKISKVKIKAASKQKRKNWIIPIFSILTLCCLWFIWLCLPYNVYLSNESKKEAYNLHFDTDRNAIRINKMEIKDNRYYDRTASRLQGSFITFLPGCRPIRNSIAPILYGDQKEPLELHIQVFVENEGEHPEINIDYVNAIFDTLRSGIIIKSISYESIPDSIFHFDRPPIIYNKLLEKGDLIKKKTNSIFSIFSIPSDDLITHAQRPNSEHFLVKGNYFLLKNEFLFVHEILHRAGVKFLKHRDNYLCRNQMAHILTSRFRDFGCHRFIHPEEITRLHGMDTLRLQKKIYFPIPKNDQDTCCSKAKMSYEMYALSSMKIDEQYKFEGYHDLNKVDNLSLMAVYTAFKNDAYELEVDYENMLRDNYGTTYDMFFKGLDGDKDAYVQRRIASHIELHKYNLSLIMSHKLYQYSSYNNNNDSIPDFSLNKWKTLDLNTKANYFDEMIFNDFVGDGEEEEEEEEEEEITEQFNLINTNSNYTINEVKYNNQVVSLNNGVLSPPSIINEENPEFDVEYSYRGFKFNQKCQANGKNNLYFLPCNSMVYKFNIPPNMDILEVRDFQENLVLLEQSEPIVKYEYTLPSSLENLEYLGITLKSKINNELVNMTIDKSKSAGIINYNSQKCVIRLALIDERLVDF